MPKFIRKKTGLGRSVGGRRFVVPKLKAKSSSHRKVIKAKADSTIESLNVLLEKDNQTKKILEQRETEVNAVYEEAEPEEFNGVSDVSEAEDLYSQALSYERKKNKSVEDQVKQIELENEKEKRELEQQIRELKRELHRTAPLHDTKFFSLSKELKEAIADLEKVASATPTFTPPAPKAVTQVPLPVEAVLAPPPAAVVTPRPAPVSVSPPPAPTPNEIKPEAKKALPQKKILVTGASAVAVLFLVSGLVAKFLTTKPEVDQKLVSEYLSQAGQVQGAQSDGQAPAQKPPEADPSQAEVNFEQSVWEEFKDPSFGILLQYPKNAVKAVRTDSNVTFIRKTGYLFKVQRVETSLSVDEYWKQIKATSLNYVASTEKFKGKTALKLTLEDITDYPGDRYLVKEGEFIYDVWYATPSTNFPDDDIKRAEKMLASLSIIEVIK